MNAALEVAGLRKSYGETEVLRGVDFSVAPGECFGLLGPNGAGKTTTLRLCLGLIEQDAGRIGHLGRTDRQQARVSGHFTRTTVAEVAHDRASRRGKSAERQRKHQGQQLPGWKGFRGIQVPGP